MKAGDLNRRVTLLRHDPDSVDEYGNPSPGFLPIATLWAARRDVKDLEKVQAWGTASTLVARFIVRSCETARAIKPADRLEHDGFTWNIIAIKEAHLGRLQFIEITASTER